MIDVLPSLEQFYLCVFFLIEFIFAASLRLFGAMLTRLNGSNNPLEWFGIRANAKLVVESHTK